MQPVKKMQQVQIGWFPPPQGWIKINSDGAFRSGQDRAGCGGLLRDHNGVWICGFSRFLGFYSATTEGLKLAASRGFERVEIHVDSTAVVSILCKGVSARMTNWSLIQ